MIVFTLFILVLMLIVSGMAVDFMRFESRRAHLQGLVDRAVLAAADLDQQSDPAAVVVDYFTKAGMIEQLKGQPTVTPGSDYRQVTANGELKLDTFFLKLIGMDQLTASATSTAIEGVGQVEISLVLDISGSMEYELDPAETMVDPVTGVTRNVRRIDRLQEAAGNFITTLLTPENAGKISISLIPYSQHVNAGPEIFNLMTTNGEPHNYSHCVEFTDTQYGTFDLDTNATYEQVQHIQMNPNFDSNGNFDANDPSITEPICPFYNYERIVPLSEDATLLTNRIDALQPRAGTQIFIGLKWAAALLDPSVKPIVNGHSERDFTNRPAAHATASTTGDTRKYIVLMTDGMNSKSDRLRSFAYDSPSEVAHWAQENFWHFIASDAGWDSSSNWRYQLYDEDDGDTLMQTLCGKVRDKNVTLFAISLGSSSDPVADEHGYTQMRNCATTPNLFYKTSGAELVEIFEDIAEQITDLRLTQ